MIIMTTTAAGYGEHQAGGGRGEEGRIQQSTTTGGPPSIATATAAAAKDDAAALDSTKIRKPYTITKQRERWTNEEHQKFLEALKLYGRAWRQIEEHIGTKTAVQIRSHAQKFFSKVERDHQIAAAATAGGGGIGKVGVVVVPEGLIDIPPPRPKRKPSHPYPRKARGNAAAASKHSEDDTPPVVSPLSAVLVTEKPKNGFWETTTTRQEHDDDDGDDDDDATEEVLEERSSPNDALPPKDSISEEDKQLPAAVATPPPLPAVQQVLSEPSWVPFPAFHAFPPQWGNSSFWNQLPNAPNHQHPTCQNFENWAQFVGGSMPREHKPPWYHPSQMAYNSAAAMAAAALWPAVVSGASSTITPVPNFSEFNGSQSLFKGITGSEDEDSASKATTAAAAASAATIAAASAWWVFTQSLASPLSFAAMGALYNPFMATMPSPLLFPQGKWLEQTKVQNPEPAAGEEEEEEEDTPQVQTLEEPTSKELLCSSSSGHHGLVRSSAAHRAPERAIWVQEVKARRGMMMAMGSSSAGSSDICASSSRGGSCSKPESGDGGSKGSGQKLELVKNHNHSGERKSTSPSSAGSSPPTQLHKLKSQLSGLVQKELSSAHARRSGDEQQREDEVGFENWKQLQDETFSGFSMNCHPVTSQCLLPALQFVKSGDLSGSNSFPTKCSNENPTEKSSSEEEHHHPPVVQTTSGSEEECGSDGGILTAENNTSAEEDSGGGGGPSSNSSACGNLPEGNDRSGSSDGSSDVEATPNVPSSCKEENEAKIVETVMEEEAAQVSSRCFSDDGLTPFRKDNEKHVHEGCAVRHLLPRNLSLEAEQQKEEAMGRRQIAFRVLFARETLPRTFSPPPRGDSLEACRAPNSDSLEALQAPTKFLSPHLQSRISSSHSKASSFVSLPAADEDHHPHTTACAADQHDNSAFNAWQPSKASKPTTVEIERCESCNITTTSSGAPQVTTKGTETQWCPKRTRDTKRRERYGEGGASFDWLTLRTESSRIPEQVKDDSVDLHFNLHQEESLHQQQSLTHNIDLFPRLKKEKFAVASSSKLDDTRSSSAFSEIISSEPFLSGSSSSNTHSSVSFLMAAPPPSSSSSGTAAAHSTVSSNFSVKYSGVGFVPYQRVPSSEP